MTPSSLSVMRSGLGGSSEPGGKGRAGKSIYILYSNERKLVLNKQKTNKKQKTTTKQCSIRYNVMTQKSKKVQKHNVFR